MIFSMIEIQVYVASLIRRNEFLVIWGDFNIHVEKVHDVFAKHFLEVMETLGLKQIVQTLTHIASGTLDLVFVKKHQTNHKIKVFNEDVDWHISDHYLVQMQIPNEPLRKQQRVNINFSNTSLLNQDNFIHDIQQELTLLPRTTNLSNKVDYLMNTITTTLNKHLPTQIKSKF